MSCEKSFVIRKWLFTDEIQEKKRKEKKNAFSLVRGRESAVVRCQGRLVFSINKIRVGGFEPHARCVGEREKVGTWRDVAESNITKLDLAFDVHFLES